MSIDGDKPMFLENAGSVYNAREYRRLMDRMLMGWDVRVAGGSATSGTANGGVARYLGSALTGDLSVTQRAAGVNMSVDVAAGAAMVGGTQDVNAGEYFVFNDAVVNVPIEASDPTNPRIDIIGVKVRDQEYSGSDNDAAIVVVKGTAAGVPSEPTLPANFLTLARVDVAAAAASIANGVITDRRRQLTAKGGVHICTSSTRPTVNLWHGMVILETDTVTAGGASVHVYDGSAFVPLGQYARAWTVITDTLLGSNTTIAFSSIPATFTHLQVMFSGRGNAAVASGPVIIRINGDTGANYDDQFVRGIAAVVSGGNGVAATSMSISGAPGTSATALASGGGFIFIPNYRGTTFHKTLIATQNWANPGGVNPTIAAMHTGNWRSTAAIASFTLDFNAVGTGWLTGTRATLIGIR